ncbi:MAG: DUF2017 domain-containing protein [Mycobacteriales bacterium]
MTARFRRRAGKATARFSAAEARVLRQVVAEVVEVLGGAEAGKDGPFSGLGTEPTLPEDPVLARLLPDGYREDPDAARELRRLTETSLRGEKVRNARVVLAMVPESGGAVTLEDEEVLDVWLRALNDVRLALGTRLGVSEEMVLDDEIEAEPDSPRAYSLAVYDWLGWLQDTLVHCATVAG